MIGGLSHIAGLLTDENAEDLLREVSGKMYIEIEKIAASRRTAPRIRDSVRPIGLKEPEGRDKQEEENVDLFQPNPLRNESQTGTPSVKKPAQRFEIRFSASEEFCRNLERAKRVCSRSWNLEVIMGRAIKDLLEKRDPERKEARRKKRESNKKCLTPSVPRTAKTQKKTEGEKSPNSELPAPPTRSGHIPVRVRDAVFNRDEGRCTYVSRNGVRCESTAHLQIDHITPCCRGGEHSIKNLRILCGKHNRLAAREMSLANS